MRASWMHFTAPFALAMLLGAVSPPPDSTDSAVHPQAEAALGKLASFFREHEIFVLTADITAEYDLNAFETIVDEGTVRISVRQPDRFRISENTRILDREIYDDGKTVTIYSPRLEPRASFPAAPTVGRTFAMAAELHGVDLPLAELFSFAGDGALRGRLTSGIPAGSEEIGGRDCDQYAFRTGTIDWQIWIAAEAPGLPCKFEASRGPDESKRPSRITAVLAWSFPDSLSDGLFEFVPPELRQNVVSAAPPNKASRAARNDELPLRRFAPR